MVLGNVIHDIVLTRDWLRRYKVIPDAVCRSDGAINPGPYREWCESLPAGVTPLRARIIDEAEIIAGEVESSLWTNGSHAAAPGVEIEVPRHAVCHDVDCKCKPDVVIRDSRGGILRLIDIKTSSRVDPDHVRAQMVRMQLWLQAAHYCRILGAKVMEFLWVETRPPYRTAWYFLTSDSMDAAVDAWRTTLLRFRQRLENDDWDDKYDPAVRLPPWFDGEDVVVVSE
jgi:hypothetical protein